MELKKIVEGMTATEVAKVIDDNFNGLKDGKADKDVMEAKIFELGSRLEDMTASVVSGYYTYSSTDVGEMTTATRNNDGGWRCIAQAVKATERYAITGTGGGGARLYCLVNNEGVIKAIAGSGETQTGFVLNVVEDGVLYCSFDRKADYSIAKIVKRIDAIENDVEDTKEAQTGMSTEIAQISENISDLQREVEGLKSADKEEVSEDLTASVSNGYYTYSSTDVGEVTTASHNYGGGWRCIAQPVKATERYVITGTGGGGARLYCLVNNEGVIKAIAGSGETQTGFVLNVVEDGTLYCSFDYKLNYSLIRKYMVKIDNDSAMWKNGAYEFGKTCNLDYTAPTIERYSLPDAGNIVNAIYGWYDSLVASYPNYVSKENCDEVMTSMGIEKPGAISHLPMYMYKFISPKAPNSSGYSASESSANRIKAFILTGTHNEYTAVWDCYNAMKLVCEKWTEDKNIEELRWNADIYIIPCYNLYGTDNSVRTNENGVDLNRNAPTTEWKVQGSLGDSTYSGEYAGSEYSTKVLVHYLHTIKPQIFIDHHNTNVGSGTNEGDGKNMIYTHCIYQLGIDISSVLISQMTRKWKMRYTDTFPSVETDNTLFGYTLHDHIKGSIGRYAAEQGCLGSTYESNFGILYKNGIYSTDNRQTNNTIVNTCATEGFVNYLVRSLSSYSQYVGVNELS